MWDARTADGVDYFLTNSHYIARRIMKCYRREANVIYPPVDIDAFAFSEQKEDYYLMASRLVPYKKVSLIAETFRAMPDRKLVIIGDGPEADKVKHLSGGNIDVNILSRVITRGLITSGRNTMLQIALEDKPGQLVGVSRIVSECGANVVSVDYDRFDPSLPISDCILRVGLETRDRAQIELIKTALTEHGLSVVAER